MRTCYIAFLLSVMILASVAGADAQVYNPQATLPPTPPDGSQMPVGYNPQFGVNPTGNSTPPPPPPTPYNPTMAAPPGAPPQTLSFQPPTTYTPPPPPVPSFGGTPAYPSATSLPPPPTYSATNGSNFTRLPLNSRNSESDDVGNWFDNTQVWIGGDVYKSLGDQTTFNYLGTTALTDSFGLVGGTNVGFALGDSSIRAQVGASYGLYDFKGRDFSKSTTMEQQVYLTYGFYRRSDVAANDRLSWGLVFDQFAATGWGFAADNIYLGQFRYLVGFAMTEDDELGVWGTAHTFSSAAHVTDFWVGASSNVRAMNQTNLFWRHNWALGGTTMAYVGFLDGADVGGWLFGFTGTAPLSDFASLYGNFTYVAPKSALGGFGPDEEQFNVSFGLLFSFGRKSISSTVSGRKGLPLMPVANNGSFLISD